MSKSSIPSSNSPSSVPLPERVRRLLYEPMTFDNNFITFSSSPFTFSNRATPLAVWLKSDLQKSLPTLNAWLLYHRAAVRDLWDHHEDYPHFVIGAALCCLKFTEEQAELVREFLTVRVMRTKKLRGLVRSNWDDLQLIEHYERPESKAALPADLESDLYKHFVETVLQDVRMARDDCWGLLHKAAKHFVLNLLEKVEVRKRHSVPLSGDEEDLNVLEDTELTELAIQARDERLYETDDDIEAFLTRLQTEQVLALIKPDLTDHQTQFVDRLVAGLRQDRTVKDVATELGIDPSTAYVHLHEIRTLYKRFST